MPRRSEFTLISELFRPLAQAPGALGLRDDAAVLRVTPGHDLVVTTDTVIAGVHFRASDPPELIARKALRVNLSDLAAKGAKPIGILQALTLDAGADDAFLEAYARGLGEDLTRFDVALLGGDTTAHNMSEGHGGPLTITVTALGEVPDGTALLRSGARPGDTLCVSGTIGDAAVGLRALQRTLSPGDSIHDEELIGRYLLPEPRLALGQALRGFAAASADISDGLCADVGHICAASNVAAEIVWSAVPRSLAVDRRLMDDPSLRDTILGGGDDYELAFTVPASRRGELPALAARTGTKITVIGHVLERAASAATANGVTVRGDFGQTIEVAVPGFTHG